MQFYHREFPPLKSRVDSSRRAFVNQVAFALFSLNSKFAGWSAPMKPGSLEEAVEIAKRDISRLDAVANEEVGFPNDIEIEDSISQVWRMQFFFDRYQEREKLAFGPVFPGCGIIDTSIGDVLVDNHLFEVKAGERKFLSVDLKQLLTYAALDYASGERKVQKLGLFNPRVGISYTTTLDELSNEVSGSTSVELLSEIVRVISSGDTSR